ncbi:MAG: hypothetical protein ABI970_00040, partial [Chloroflexota bacterium]
MKFTNCALFIILLLTPFTVTGKNQSLYGIYYQDGDAIYEISDLSNKPSIITSFPSELHQV